MKSKAVRALQSIQWLPAERLGQLNVEATLRPWLIAKGVLTARLKDAWGDRFTLHLVDQWSGLLTSSQKLGLRSEDTAGLFRDVEMRRGDQMLVFAQTVTPDSTLSQHGWLAELGDAPLDATLEGLSAVERSSYEYAWLTEDDPLAARVLRDADLAPPGVWARRCRVTLRGAPMLVQEVFLPGMGLA